MKKILGLLFVVAILMATTATVDAACYGKIGVKVVDWFNKPKVGCWVYLDNTMPTSLQRTDSTGYTTFKNVLGGKTHKVIVKSGIYTQTKSVYVPCTTSFPVLYFKI